MRVGLSACSNGHRKEWMHQINELIDVLKTMDVEPVLVKHIETKIDEFSGDDKERAAELMEFFKDDSISAIYDISGGDLANGVLQYLDYEIIANSNKLFWGYSDLTTVINAIYSMTKKPSVLYQVKNLVYSAPELQQHRFKEFINGNDSELFGINYKFLQGNSMGGIVVGGNIRCFLKLAGTRYWPDMDGKILLLESYGGGSGQIATLINQLDDIGVFEQVAGILLGTFTDYEKANLQYSVYDLLEMHIGKELPVAYTTEIGHGHDSKAIIIGKEMSF